MEEFEVRTDRVYILMDGQAFFSPDGKRTVWCNDRKEAATESGLLTFEFLNDDQSLYAFDML